MMQVCTLGFDDGQVKDELQRLAQAFSVGSPPLPLTALVIQVRAEGQVYILYGNSFGISLLHWLVTWCLAGNFN